MAVGIAARRRDRVTVPMQQEHLRVHRHVDHRRMPSKTPAGRERMPARNRLAVHSVLGKLWLSGCAWLVLDQFFESRGQFGRTPHPLAPAILMMHGIVAIL